MLFESFLVAQSTLLWAVFGVAFVLGAVVNKTNFCTMGAVSDMVNMDDYSRFRSWLLAIAVAVIGMLILESSGMVNADGSFPPYRGSQLVWAENLLGGFLFGIGMTLASGCGNKTLIRIGGGNIKSIIVFLIIAVIAYFMTTPFPGSDQTLFSILFYDWIRPLAVSLDTRQDLGSIINSENPVTTRLIVGGIIALLMLVYIFRAKAFRTNPEHWLAGIVVGLAVLAGWYLSSSVMVDMVEEGEQYTLVEYYENWDMISDSEEGKPAQGATLSPQSFTFINPIGQTAGYVASGLQSTLLTFGIMSVFGVILGSFVWSLVSKSFRIEWFFNVKDFVTHVIGAVLMGFGGVLAMGCTIGQGITGFSTLAVGSMIAFTAIIFGSALTMKTQYYQMLYEDASFFAALITALVELRLLPASMRKLEAL
ncbi:MAG: YeeE/YedE family protein [gamma proteobacterium symbiont of Lucinoma myriamae]|nr:YeeE/YedE family protein [gamma proteobacterium symbiont of Lucinoma myriamae]MCU7817945.1 YeeE/YedE family protein [gamma proteobacterium symbiont of Lucinoma myriamae]MCU7832382.1 YeeE/YedE family protein [gamma proteobacterium symbiont of Lucinoma myriamae]